MASEGGASFSRGRPGVTLAGRGRSMSCTFHFCPGICGVSVYPRTSSPAEGGGSCATDGGAQSAEIRTKKMNARMSDSSLSQSLTQWVLVI